MGSKKVLFDDILGRQTDTNRNARLTHSVKSSCSVLQRLRILKKLEVHQGCVNTLSWNATGNLLLSGSDDHRLVISNPYTYKTIHEVPTSHRANIFSAKFLPDTADLKLVSCAGDGTILLTDIIKQEETVGCTFNCHNGTVYEMLAIPGDPNTFFSCGEDGSVRWFDIRVKTSCRKEDCKDDVIISLERAVTSICLNPLVPYHLAVGCSDSTVRIFDRRLLSTRSTGCLEENTGFGALFSRFSVPDFEGKQRRITSVDYRPDGQELLVSYSSDYLYIFDPREDNPNKGKKLKVGRPRRKSKSGRSRNKSPQPMKKLRLRGDWSDTGPNARPETDQPAASQGATVSERPTLQTTLMQRMTDALSRMLNDPGTRSAMQRVSQVEGGATQEGEERQQTDRNWEVRDSLNLGDQDAPTVEDQQTLAATAIQERWRRFKRSRQAVAEEGSTSGGTSNPRQSRSDDTDGRGSSSESGPVEKSKDGPSLLCCRSNKVNHESTTQTVREHLNIINDDENQSGEETQNEEKLPKEQQNVSLESNKEKEEEDWCEGMVLTDGTGLVEVVQASNHINQTTEVEPEPCKFNSITHSEQSSIFMEKDIEPETTQNQQPLNQEISKPATRSSPASADAIPVKKSGPAGTDTKPDSRSGPVDTDSFIEVEKSKMFEFVHSVIDITKNFQVANEDKVINESVSGNDVDDEISGLEETSTASKQDTKIIESKKENLDAIDDYSKREDPSCNVTIKNSNILALTNTNNNDKIENVAECDTESLEGTSKNMENLRESIENLRETGVEPTLALTYRGEGTSSSSISIGEAVPLPGPSRIVTGPVTGGINPVTGARQRRTGMSSVPTSSILPQERSLSLESEEEHDTNVGIVEYETDESEEEFIEGGEFAKENKCDRSINQPPFRKKFVGHRNARTMIKEATWWGNDYVLSGSDCGHLFAWERESSKLVMMVEADRHVVNCLQPHPSDPLLATSGIDYDVKLWAPIGEQPNFDLEAASVVMKRNEVMLEETRDTITVPASLMIRMLASLNQIRRGQVVPRVLEPREDPH